MIFSYEKAFHILRGQICRNEKHQKKKFLLIILLALLKHISAEKEVFRQVVVTPAATIYVSMILFITHV